MASTQSKETPFIAILGAGIGGLALAIGLGEQKVHCIIYEAALEFSTVGAGVGLGPNALLAMSLIDPSFGQLYDAVKTGNTSPEKVHHTFEVMMDEPGLGERRGWKGAGVGAEYFVRTSAHRKALLDIMTRLLDPEFVEVKFGKRAVDITSSENTGIIRVTFQDGETIQPDALIGCDGIKGVTRQAVLGSSHPALVQPAYTGFYTWRCILPMKLCQEILGSRAGDANMFMGSGRNLIIYPISNGEEVNFVWFVWDDKPWLDERITLECSKEEMLKGLQGVDDRLFKFTEYIKPLKWAIFHHPETPIYYKGRICLLGDSAHAASPHQAAGASQALEDALVMSRLIGLVKQPTDFEAVFKVFDSIRRPRAEKVVTTSYEAGQIYMFRKPDIKDDMQKIVDNGNTRLPWIWTHDLRADVAQAVEQFQELVGR